MFSFLKKWCNSFQRDYLIKTIIELEKWGSENNRWVVGHHSTKVLAELFIVNHKVLNDFDFMGTVGDLRLESMFSSLSDLEDYVEEYLNSAELFIKGESNGKPKVTRKGLPTYSVEVFEFMEIESNRQLIDSLKRIVKICDKISTTVDKVVYTRRVILQSSLGCVFTSLLTVLEGIAEEVANANEVGRTIKQ